MDEQTGLLDLIPRRRIGLAMALFPGILAMVCLLSGYAWMVGRVNDGGSTLAALDLGGKGSLGCWFSSLTLLAASFIAILIYSVRRHRTDDYQGRYRIWRWAAGCWFLLATDQAASLREGFREAMTAVTGAPLSPNGDLWWVVFYALLLGAIGSRLFVDMRTCLMAASFLIGAMATHVLAVAVRLGWMLPPLGEHETMFIAGAEMSGNLMLMAAMLYFARHVILDAEGLLPRIQQEDEGEDIPVRHASSGDSWRKIDPPHAPPPPVFQRTPSQPVPSTASSSASAAVPPPPINRKLTKAEKKALKERLLRQRSERERSGQ